MARILVIDNIQTDNEQIVKLVSMAGYEVYGVPCVKRGLALAKSIPINLIITEVLMPDEDGVELLFRFKKAKITIPVIAISAGGKIPPDYYLKLATDFGAVFAFKKPIITQALLAAIDSVLIDNHKGVTYGNGE